MAENRIVTTKTFEVEHGNGSRTRFRGGEHYLLNEEMADEFVSQRRAYYEGDPPYCGACGRTFEGPGAWAAFERHEREGHEDAFRTWTPGHGEPPALDYSHPHVAELEEKTVDDLKEIAHGIGVADADVVGTGSGGSKLKEDWIRHILRARGERYIYEPVEHPEDETHDDEE